MIISHRSAIWFYSSRFSQPRELNTQIRIRWTEVLEGVHWSISKSRSPMRSLPAVWHAVSASCCSWCRCRRSSSMCRCSAAAALSVGWAALHCAALQCCCCCAAACSDWWSRRSFLRALQPSASTQRPHSALGRAQCSAPPPRVHRPDRWEERWGGGGVQQHSATDWQMYKLKVPVHCSRQPGSALEALECRLMMWEECSFLLSQCTDRGIYICGEDFLLLGPKTWKKFRTKLQRIGFCGKIYYRRNSIRIRCFKHFLLFLSH